MAKFVTRSLLRLPLELVGNGSLPVMVIATRSALLRNIPEDPATEEKLEPVATRPRKVTKVGQRRGSFAQGALAMGRPGIRI